MAFPFEIFDLYIFVFDMWGIAELMIASVAVVAENYLVPGAVVVLRAYYATIILPCKLQLHIDW